MTESERGEEVQGFDQAEGRNQDQARHDQEAHGEEAHLGRDRQRGCEARLLRSRARTTPSQVLSPSACAEAPCSDGRRRD